MNLQRQEAFDEQTEALHKSLSRRGSVGRRKEKPESELLKVIASPSVRRKSTRSSSKSRGSRRSKSSSGPRPEKMRSRSSSRPRPDKSRTSSRTGDVLRSSSYHHLQSAAESIARRDSLQPTVNATFSSGRHEKSPKALEASDRSERRSAKRLPSRTKSGDIDIGEKYRKDSSGRSNGRSPRKLLPARSKSFDDGPLMVDDEENVQIWADETVFTPLAAPSNEKLPKRRSSGSGGTSKKTFEALLRNLPRTRGKAEDGDARSVGTKEDSAGKEDNANSGSEENATKKTKLQKIMELQAKCDRYKKEWLDTSRDKKRLRNEILEGKELILILTKQIDVHESEASILQKKLSEALQRLDELQAEQYKERNGYSMTAKELAESRIEFSRALNETRLLKQDLDKMEESLKEKDRRIGDLEDELRQSKNQADELDSDLNFAEEAVLKLERDMKLLEEELSQYREVATEQNGEHDREKMREVRDAMEKRMLEDREERLREKQAKLEQKIEQFEREREQFLNDEKERKVKLEERIREEVEKHRSQEMDYSRRNEDITGRLDALESDNKVLQGRLKSEQLDSRVKLQQKDERIDLLQKELSSVNAKLAELGSDPESASSLKREAETAKSHSTSLQEELTEVQKHNSMLTDEIDELKSSAKALQSQVKALRQEVATHKKEAEQWQRKSQEWEAKSGEWTDKAHLWKDKADKWEKIGKESNSEATNTDSPIDPQANFLQAALDRKKSLIRNESVKWGVLGGLLTGRATADEAGGDMQERLQELQAENAQQAEVIKNLRKEMMTTLTDYKEKAYTALQQMQELVKERDDILLKNTNLKKELDLARKLQSMASLSTDD